MKKTLAIVLALVIVLSLSVSAFAAGSPSGSINKPVEDDPSWYEGGWPAPAPSPEVAEELTAEEQAEVDAAVELALAEEGISEVIEAKLVKAEGEVEVPVSVPADAFAVVVKDGEVAEKLSAKTIAKLGGVLTVEGPCVIVICK